MLPLPLTHSHTHSAAALWSGSWERKNGKSFNTRGNRGGERPVGVVCAAALSIRGHTPQRHTLFFSSAQPHARAGVNACCQAGRDREDAHLAHTCPHTHRDAHRGAHHGGPGSGDAWENPPADAKAAGGDSAEEQWREGKAGLPPSFSVPHFLPFVCRVVWGCLSVCWNGKTWIFVFLAKWGLFLDQRTSGLVFSTLKHCLRVKTWFKFRVRLFFLWWFELG